MREGVGTDLRGWAVRVESSTLSDAHLPRRGRRDGG